MNLSSISIVCFMRLCMCIKIGKVCAFSLDTRVFFFHLWGCRLGFIVTLLSLLLVHPSLFIILRNYRPGPLASNVGAFLWSNRRFGKLRVFTDFRRWVFIVLVVSDINLAKNLARIIGALGSSKSYDEFVISPSSYCEAVRLAIVLECVFNMVWFSFHRWR